MLTEPDLAYLAELGESLEFEEAAIIFRKGEPGDAMYVILEGAVELLFESGAPAKQLGPGEFFGELVLLSEPSRSATALTGKPSRLCRIGRAEFASLAQNRPQLFHNILWGTCAYLLASETRLLRELGRREPSASNKELREWVESSAARRAALEQASSFVLSWGAAAMVPVLQALRRVAPTRATVLLLGESGTGKELAARAVHAWSPRAQGPFVVLDCATLSEQLAESELFGHEKGAFTGASALRRGWIELAEGGSLFFDEVGELPLSLQSKLLRVLETRSFARLGGARLLESDVRWLAATNRDLRSMVEQGRFREDLYHRLAVFSVELPPLRERREDLAPLSSVLLSRLRETLDRPALRLSSQASRLLEAAPWPGNVRQLRNVLERAAILAETDEILPAHLDLGLEAALPPKPGAAGKTLSEIERESILDALASQNGNRKRAAERLGIGLRTLYEKLKRYDLG